VVDDDQHRRFQRKVLYHSPKRGCRGVFVHRGAVVAVQHDSIHGASLQRWQAVDDVAIHVDEQIGQGGEGQSEFARVPNSRHHSKTLGCGFSAA
jgi:hypothetical protein